MDAESEKNTSAGLHPTKVSRPALRWHGGKWILAPWIIRHFPKHRVYVEPFGGAASVLLRKPKSYAEVYNDLDDDVVNLFRVLRSDDSTRLVEQLRLSPFSATEFANAYQSTDDPIEKARRLVVRSFQGFGSNSTNNRSGFRSNSNRSGTTPAHDWANYPDALRATIERLRGVTITCRPAIDVMDCHDGPETLHYVDPPYVHATRGNCAGYRHEMSDQDHVELIEFLKGLSGKVVLSGYPSYLYDDELSGWTRVETDALADGARKRKEVLWLNFVPEISTETQVEMFCDDTPKGGA